MNRETLKRQGAVLLPAIAYGDTARSIDDIPNVDHIAERLWGDVTKHNVAITRALIAADGFNIDTIAQAELSVSSQDNDTLTHLAPLAYWQVARRTPVTKSYQQFDQLTDLSNESALARLTTRVHGDALAYLLTHEYNKRQFLEMLDGSLGIHEFETHQTGMLRDNLMYLHGRLGNETILTYTEHDETSAVQTLAKAYGAFVAHNGEFKAAVAEATNVGGNISNVASIVASMSAFASKDILRMPIDHQNIEHLDTVKSLSRKLANTALKK
jgi:ADP-ribosylglycohydrolase